MSQRHAVAGMVRRGIGGNRTGARPGTCPERGRKAAADQENGLSCAPTALRDDRLCQETRSWRYLSHRGGGFERPKSGEGVKDTASVRIRVSTIWSGFEQDEKSACSVRVSELPHAYGLVNVRGVAAAVQHQSQHRCWSAKPTVFLEAAVRPSLRHPKEIEQENVQ